MVEKVIDIKLNYQQPKKGLKEINAELQEQRDILILLEKELLKAQQALDAYYASNKINYAQETQLKKALQERKAALQDQKLGIKTLTQEQRVANDAYKNFNKLTTDNTNIVRGIDKLTGGYATKILKLGKGFKSGIKATKKFALGLKGLRGALISTGIGALVVALGLIIAYWDDISGAINGVSSQQKDLLSTQEDSVATSEKQSEILKDSENTLRLQGKTEKEIKELKRQQLNETIANLEAQLLTQESIKKTQIEASKRNKKIAMGFIAVLSAPVTVFLGLIDGLTNSLASLGIISKGTNLTAGFLDMTSSMLFDPDEVGEKADETIEVTKDKLRKLKNTRDGEILKDREDKKKSQKKQDDEEKKAAKELEALKDRIREAEANKDDEARKLELTKIKEHNEKLLEEARLAGLLTEELKTSLAERLQAKQDEFDKQDEEKRLKKLEEDQDKRFEELELSQEFDTLTFEQQREILNQRQAINLEDETLSEEQRTELANQFSDARTEIANRESEAKAAAAMSFANSLGKVGNLIGKETQAGKLAASAAALIQTYLAAQQARTSQLAIPTPDAPVRAALAMAVEIAAGLKNVKEINTIKVPRASGGGTAPTPSASPAPPSFNIIGATETSQLADAVASQTQEPVQAYVVANDVTTAQSLENGIIEGATL